MKRTPELEEGGHGRRIAAARLADEREAGIAAGSAVRRQTATRAEHAWVASVTALDPDLLAAGRVDSK